MLLKRNILSGLDPSRTFSKPVRYEDRSSIKPFMFVALDGAGMVTVPPCAGFFPVYLVLTLSMSEPAALAAGTVSLMYGKMRILTDQVVMPCNPGDVLFVNTEGKLEALQPRVGMTALGYVERIVDDQTIIAYIRPFAII